MNLEKKKSFGIGRRKQATAQVQLEVGGGTFLVNGIERVIINQIVRSPGIYYKSEIDRQGSRTYIASLISNRGTWIKFEIDSENSVHVKIDKAKKHTYSFPRIKIQKPTISLCILKSIN